VTEKILGIVENNMLQADPKNRGSAFEVSEKVKSCLDFARRDAEKTGFYKVPSYFKFAIHQEQQQESQVIQDRMAKEGSEEWRDKYRSKAFIEATKEPLLAGTQLDDHEGPFDTFSSVHPNLQTRTNLQRSSTCFTGLGRNSRNSFCESAPLQTQHDSSQPPLDVLHADYMEARRLLEVAGWRSGTLEIPQSPETVTETTKSPQSPQRPRSSAYSFTSLRSPQSSTEPSRSKSNKRPMSLMRRLMGTSSKSKPTSSPRSSALSPVDPVTPFSGQESVEAQKAGGRMRGRENSEPSIHRYEKFDTYFKGRDIVRAHPLGRYINLASANDVASRRF
jgi:hypothetical protein